VLTLERLLGIRGTDGAALDAARRARPLLARTATDLFLKMAFEDGFFHADPHPGNLSVESQGRVGLIDSGTVGAIDAGPGPVRDRGLPAGHDVGCGVDPEHPEVTTAAKGRHY
jgi:ABC1 atypical kinase-like domain